MSVYDWEHYTTNLGAVKMHTLLDYDCLLTDFVHITDVKSPTIRRLMKLMSGRIALWLPTVDIAAMDF